MQSYHLLIEVPADVTRADLIRTVVMPRLRRSLAITFVVLGIATLISLAGNAYRGMSFSLRLGTVEVRDPVRSGIVSYLQAVGKEESVEVPLAPDTPWPFSVTPAGKRALRLVSVPEDMQYVAVAGDLRIRHRLLGVVPYSQRVEVSEVLCVPNYYAVPSATGATVEGTTVAAARYRTVGAGVELVFAGQRIVFRNGALPRDTEILLEYGQLPQNIADKLPAGTGVLHCLRIETGHTEPFAEPADLFLASSRMPAGPLVERRPKRGPTGFVVAREDGSVTRVEKEREIPVDLPAQGFVLGFHRYVGTTAADSCQTVVTGTVIRRKAMMYDPVRRQRYIQEYEELQIDDFKIGTAVRVAIHAPRKPAPVAGRELTRIRWRIDGPGVFLVTYR